MPHRSAQSRTALQAARRNAIPGGERRRSNISNPESSHRGQDLKLKYEKKQDQVIQAARKRTEEARQDFEESNAKVRAMESAERASWVKKVQQDAEKAWRRRVLEMRASPSDSDNFGGLQIAWTEPPIILDATPEVRALLRCQRLQALAEINGKDVQQMNRTEILEEITVFNGSIRFLPLDETIRALFPNVPRKQPTLQGEAEENEGGPLQLIRQMLQALVLIPLLLIAVLVTSFLRAVTSFLGAGKAELEARYRLSVRRFAEKALSRGPRALEDHSEGHNWIGGLDMIWTTPPTVRGVKPHLQQFCDVEPGDRLVSVDDEPTEALGREEVLKLLSGSASGLNFMNGERWQRKKDEERLVNRMNAVIRKGQKVKGSHRS